MQRDDGDILPSIKRCAVQVDGSVERLIRRGRARRNLWRAELPLLSSLIWLLASALIFEDFTKTPARWRYLYIPWMFVLPPIPTPRSPPESNT